MDEYDRELHILGALFCLGMLWVTAISGTAAQNTLGEAGKELRLRQYWHALDGCRAERGITVPDLDSECIQIARRAIAMETRRAETEDTGSVAKP